MSLKLLTTVFFGRLCRQPLTLIFTFDLRLYAVTPTNANNSTNDNNNSNSNITAGR